ncbi:MAG: hypothetical protein SFY68_01675, partial [Candidatus Sumerlaeia bacterium]|nr:hypothetical protein [Candidatus Sumerlaeia bacterium]
MFFEDSFRSVAEDFDLSACSVFQLSENNLLSCWIWNERGVNRSREALAQSYPLFREFIHSLFDGLSLPEDYGLLHTEAEGKHLYRIINHYSGTLVPELDAFMLRLSAGLELSFPLQVVGMDRYLLNFYRSEDETFSEEEINKLAVLAGELGWAVLLKEHTQVLQQNAELKKQRDAQMTQLGELEHANGLFRRSLGTLHSDDDPERVFGFFLTEAIQIIGACRGAIFLYDEVSNSLFVKSFYHEGRLIDVHKESGFEIWREPIPWEGIGAAPQLFAEEIVWGTFEEVH